MILHITDYYRPRVGGIETQVEELAAAQHAAGLDVAVLAYTAADLPTPDDGGFAVHRIPNLPPHGVAPHPGVLTRVRPLLDQLRPDVVHAHFSSVSPAAWAGGWWALDRPVPVVATVHSLWDRRTRAGHRISDRLLDWSRRIPLTAVSDTCARHVRQALPDADITVVPNGIHPDRWHLAGPAGPTVTSRREIHVVSVGRLTPWRQPMLVLDTLRRARQRLATDLALSATVIGSGSCAAEMARYLRRHGMDSWVELTGQLDGPGIREVFATADIYLNASSREAFGIATLEARTAGLPVVAHAATGVSDFIGDGQEGLLAPDPEGLVTALMRLCRDDSLRRRIAASNRSSDAGHCSWPAVLKAFEQRYDHAAARPPRSGGPTGSRIIRSRTPSDHRFAGKR